MNQVCIFPILLFSFLVRRRKNLLALLCVGGFIFHSSIASAIEVGGHLTEDTIWSPANNPYEVTETLFVDAGVTLTILPGTEIKISGASCSSWQDFDQNFWLYNGISVAKYIQVDGRIIAEGSEQLPILFTRLQDEQYYKWGTIRIMENAEHCSFRYCTFEHMNAIGIAINDISKGLSFCNGKGSVRNCTFHNHSVGVSSNSPTEFMEITDNKFIIDSDVSPFMLTAWREHIVTYRTVSIDSPSLLICNNTFEGYDTYVTAISRKGSFAYNSITECDETIIRGYYYNNLFNDCCYGIRFDNEGDSLYIKENSFIGGRYGVSINHAYVEISDNYFEGCSLSGPSEVELIGAVYNNVIKNAFTAISGRYKRVFNNLFLDSDLVTSVIGSSNIYSNNVMINNMELCNLLADTPVIENNVFFNNGMDNIDIFNTPIFRNCIIDFPLEPPLVDGGGNIIVDSLQAQSIFEDIQNGDFHLAPGSIAIDVGFDTLGYYYPFDLENNMRVWDGDGDGNAVIDIGAYEYGAPALGKICGYITETTSGEPVNYVLIKANNEPGEFTFADSSGYFEFQLPEGVYDLYAERVFYEDAIVYSVSVENGLSSEVDFNMTYDDPMVSVSGNELNINNSKLNISNYPNPFNPSTTISYSIPAAAAVELSIYNVKGQKVVTLVNQHQEAGEFSAQWNGIDADNKPVSSGVYFYKVVTNKATIMKKMLLLK